MGFVTLEIFFVYVAYDSCDVACFKYEIYFR